MDKVEFDNILHNIVSRVVGLDPNCEIFIFGSFVEGRFTGESDLDVAVIIADGSDRKKFIESIYKPGVLSKWPIDLIVMSKSDYNKKKEVGGVAFDINEAGVQLYPNWKLNGTK